jgi:hypothetical protein
MHCACRRGGNNVLDGAAREVFSDLREAVGDDPPTTREAKAMLDRALEAIVSSPLLRKRVGFELRVAFLPSRRKWTRRRSKTMERTALPVHAGEGLPWHGNR